MYKLFVSIVILILLSACGNETDRKENSTDKEIKETVILDNSPGRELSYKFFEGRILRYNLKTDLISTQSIEADSSFYTGVKQNAEYVFELKVNRVDENEIAYITIRNNSIKVEGDFNGEKMSYDSRMFYSSRERKLFSDYEALKSKSYNVKVTKFGEVLDISDVGSILNELLEIQEMKNKISKDEKKSLEDQLIMSGIAPLTEQLFRKTTRELLTVGGSWDQKYPSSFAGFEIDNVARYIIRDFKNVGNDIIAEIDGSLSISARGQNDFFEEGIKYHIKNPEVSGYGKINYNITKGCLQDSESLVKMYVEISMEAVDENQRLVKAVKKESIENKSRLKLISIK